MITAKEALNKTNENKQATNPETKKAVDQLMKEIEILILGQVEKGNTNCPIKVACSAIELDLLCKNLHELGYGVAKEQSSHFSFSSLSTNYVFLHYLTIKWA